MKDQQDKHAGQKTKVFLIAGFLGAGKTTLLKRILGWHSDLSDTVVMVNEFGEVGVDGDLLKGAGSDVVELTSGCICCTLTADLLQSLSDIKEKYEPRRIIIESSGVADPASVVTVLTESLLADSMELEKIVTVLDADFWEVRENFGRLFFSQLETAHLILLNKIDLVDGDQVPTFLKEIREEIAGSQVIPAIRCAIDPETLWTPAKAGGIGFQPMSAFKELSLDDAMHPAEEDANHPTSVAANNFVTFSFENEDTMDETRFRQFVDGLPVDVFRMKGPVRFKDRTRVVNFVGGRAEWSDWGEEAHTRLAFIGWNVEPEALLADVRNCINR